LNCTEKCATLDSPRRCSNGISTLMPYLGQAYIHAATIDFIQHRPQDIGKGRSFA
jgi:hypothetical protein